MEKRIPGLDGLRALSALAVAFMHAKEFHAGELPVGWIGVQVFYVLSGFLITGVLLNARKSMSSLGEELKRFYYRRSLRIFPLYYLYLLVIAVPLIHYKEHLFPSLLTYTYNIHRALYPEQFGLATHLWSLAVEEQFYLVWPLFVLTLSPRHFRYFAIAVVILSPALRESAHLLLPAYNSSSCVYFLTPYQLDGFAVGAVLSTLSRKQMQMIRTPFTITLLTLTGLVLLYNRHLAYFGFLWLMEARRGQFTWGYTLVDCLAGILVMLCCTHAATTPFLEWAPLRFLGRISYGFYVWHIACLLVAGKLVQYFGFSNGRVFNVLFFAVFLLLDLAVATLSYRFYELRFLRYKDHFFRRPNAAPQQSVTTHI